MKKYDNQIFSYLAGSMTPEEKAIFEEQLQSSSELNFRYRQLNGILDGIREKGTIPLDDAYFSRLNVELNRRIADRGSNVKKRMYARLSLAGGMAAAVIAGALFLLRPATSINTVEGLVSNMNEDARTELLDHLSDKEDLTNFENQVAAAADDVQQIVEEKLNTTLSDEILNTGSADASGIGTIDNIDPDEVIGDLTDSEAENVYQAMLTKKIL